VAIERDFSPDGSDGTPFDDLKPFYTETPDACGNCGKPCEETVWLPKWKYFACSDCQEEARITEFAEDNCTALYRAVLRAKSVSGARKGFPVA
jgi:hypothetical protein